MELHHFFINDSEYFFSRRGPHHGKAGEFTEGGEDAMRGSEVITGEGE